MRATPGAVAAPTAGLHFDPPLLERCRRAASTSRAVTLHVGAGTFQPVRADELAAHRMHAEAVSVPASGSARDRARARGTADASSRSARRSCARSRSAAAARQRSRRATGETRLFIVPGHRFRVGGRAADQFPPAGIDAADAGRGFRRPRARARRVSSRGRRTLPVLQLRGRDVRAAGSASLARARRAREVRAAGHAMAPRGAAGSSSRAARSRRRPSCRSAPTARSRRMTPEELAGLGAQIVLGNTFHLMLRPGTEVIEAHGGLHRLHALGPADPDRLRRLPGVQPGGAAQAGRAGRAASARPSTATRCS